MKKYKGLVKNAYLLFSRLFFKDKKMFQKYDVVYLKNDPLPCAILNVNSDDDFTVAYFDYHDLQNYGTRWHVRQKEIEGILHNLSEKFRAKKYGEREAYLEKNRIRCRERAQFKRLEAAQAAARMVV